MPGDDDQLLPQDDVERAAELLRRYDDLDTFVAEVDGLYAILKEQQRLAAEAGDMGDAAACMYLADLSLMILSVRQQVERLKRGGNS
jgi:hypothetical protein